MSRRWRRRLFAPEKRKRQAAAAVMVFVCVILVMAVDYVDGNGRKYLERDGGQALFELDTEKKPPKKSEYGIHIEWREGRIIFYRAEEEPYIVKEAETAVTH